MIEIGGGGEREGVGDGGVGAARERREDGGLDVGAHGQGCGRRRRRRVAVLFAPPST